MHFRLTKETLDLIPHRIQGGEITYKLYPGVQVSCFITERDEMEALMLHPHFEKLLTHPSQIHEIKEPLSIPHGFRVIRMDTYQLQDPGFLRHRLIGYGATVVGGAADGGEIYELKNPRSNGYDYTLYLYKTGPVRASVVRRTLRTKTEVWLYPSSTTNLSTMHNRAIHAVLSDIEEKGMSEFFSPAGK